MRLFSVEQVSKFHPDKFADQVGDAILTECLKQDNNAQVGCEVMIKDTTCVLGGEISGSVYVDYEAIVKRVANKLNYKINKVINLIGLQSLEIKGGIDQDEDFGAGDQGFCMSYACQDTPNKLPYGLHLANEIIRAVEFDIENNPHTILKGDAKTQVTVDLDRVQNIKAVHSIVLSVCHLEGITIEEVRVYLKNKILSKFDFNDKVIFFLNPAGTWTIGGPTSDCGILGRKLPCDTLSGYYPIGGGAQSGKNPIKVDRSGCYMARYLAKWIIGRTWKTKNSSTEYNFYDAGVQLAYAIGVSKPVSVGVNLLSCGLSALKKSELENTIAETIENNFDLSPRGIINFLDMYNINYEIIAEGNHFRDNLFNWERP